MWYIYIYIYIIYFFSSFPFFSSRLFPPRTACERLSCSFGTLKHFSYSIRTFRYTVDHNTSSTVRSSATLIISSWERAVHRWLYMRNFSQVNLEATPRRFSCIVRYFTLESNLRARTEERDYGPPELVLHIVEVCTELWCYINYLLPSLRGCVVPG